MDPETVVGWSKDAADQLIPGFEEAYDIEIEQPQFVAVDWFSGIPSLVGRLPRVSGVEMRCAHAYSTNDDGDGESHNLIGIGWCGEPSREVFEVVTAHELGHAAINQNTPGAPIRRDPACDDAYIDILHEGVAERFKQEGLDALYQEALDEGDEEAAREYRRLKRQQRYVTGTMDATWRKIRPTKYSQGRAFFADTSQKYVEQAVKEPRTVYDDIVDHYG